MKLLSFPDTPFQIQLSFDSVIDNLESAVNEKANRQAGHEEALLKEINQHPELRTGITDIAQIESNAGLIRRLLAEYFPEPLTLNEIKGVSFPYLNVVFNRTQRFNNILKAAGDNFEFNIRDLDQHQFYVLNCCLILNEFYNTKLDFRKPLFYDIPASDGTIRHYRILYNADFLDILPTERSVKLTSADIDQLINNYDNLDLWMEKFPPKSWLIKGFALMSLIDVTIENAVSVLKERLLRFDAASFEQSIDPVFQSIFDTPHIKIGFTLFNSEDNTLSIAAFGKPLRSFIMEGTEPRNINDVLCPGSYQALIVERRYFAVSDTSDFHIENPDSSLACHVAPSAIRSFILAPVVKDDEVIGLLEVVSKKSKELNSINANKLDVVMPYITDNIKRLIVEFQNQIQAFIQEKFTTIHSSVYWKFKEEAQRYIYSRRRGEEKSLGAIVFNEVFPLYGEIDIKGSSAARNLSVQKDLQTQVLSLLSLLQKIPVPTPSDGFEKGKRQLELFLQDLLLPVKASTEQYITDYILNNIHPWLSECQDPGLASAIKEYFIENDKASGVFHAHRRKYEQSITMVNEKLAGIIDNRQEGAQQAFPHYYERFKTDGIEHNLYIGPSIAPGQAFTEKHLRDLRLWQLKVLCEMEKAHHYYKPSLPYPLDVTTLVLVYDTPISVRFRMDEKRLDVDGSYNARFEIVKKRIDKACVLNTDERITQPGKITIVYSNLHEEKEYSEYVHLLQEQNILGRNIEKLDVEDLQGVVGLRALRVKINHDNTSLTMM